MRVDVNSKLKILIVEWSVYSEEIPEMKTTPSGGGIAIYDIADGLGEYEDVTLLLMQKPLCGRKLKHMILADTKNLYEEAPIDSDITNPKIIRNEKMKYVFEKILSTNEFDIVNFQGGGEAEVDCIDICGRCNVPCITTDHLFIGRNKDFEKYEESVSVEQKLLSKPGVLVSVVSNGERKKLLRDYTEIKPEQVFAIPNGIRMPVPDNDDDPKCKKIISDICSFAQGRKILVCSGTLLGRKNQLQLVDAWKYLSSEVKSNLTIAFLGKDCMNGRLQSTIKENNLESSLCYIGLLTPKQSMSVYKAADGIISVSKAEGLSLVFLEAMSCGKPLVFYRDSECADDINDEKVVTFIGSRSDEAVAKGIERWYYGTWDSEYIKHYALKNFSRDRMIRQYVDMFHKIVIGRKEQL